MCPRRVAGCLSRVAARGALASRATDNRTVFEQGANVDPWEQEVAGSIPGRGSADLGNNAFLRQWADLCVGPTAIDGLERAEPIRSPVARYGRRQLSWLGA